LDKTKVLKGKDGRIWMNDDKQGICNSVEIKVNLEYEELDIPGEALKQHLYMGGSGEGTMSGYKIDSRFILLLAEGVKTGNMPQVKIVAKLANQTGTAAQIIAIEDVQFNELMLAQYEQGSTTEEEVSFTFGDFDIIDTI
jgi:hypothetical protein